MRKKWVRILIAGMVLAAFGGLGWQLWRRSAPEPVYAGKPLSYWLMANMHRTVPDVDVEPKVPNWYTKESESEHAIRQIGTNAIPFLLCRLRLSESPFKQKFFYYLQEQRFLNFSNTDLVMAKFEAQEGFQTLGPTAQGCVPELIAICENPQLPLARSLVLLVLAEMGPTARESVPLLLKILTNTNELDRWSAAFALGRIHADPELAVPALMKLLNDPFSEVRAEGARALGSYGKAARAAVPFLLKLREKENQESLSKHTSAGLPNLSSGGSIMQFGAPFSSDVAEMAAEAVSKIDRETAAKAGISTGPQPGTTGFDRGSNFLFDPLRMGARR